MCIILAWKHFWHLIKFFQFRNIGCTFAHTIALINPFLHARLF